MFGQELRLLMDSRPVQYGKKYSPHDSTVVIFYNDEIFPIYGTHFNLPLASL